LYNDIITALKLKKDGFAELPDDLKPFFIDVRGRAMMNISLMLFKEAENSEKEDLKIKNAQKILEFCNELIKLNPKHNKAFFRKAQAFILKKEYNSALDELKRLLEIDPNNKDAKDLFKRIKRETQKNDVKEKKVYQGIFLGNKWAEESEKDEIETQKKVEIESKAFFEWKEEMRRKKDEEDLKRMEYETMVKQLEKGMIIDTNDSADPVTDLFLLDN
jgi:tetratricopeptide (TPR) repeat protein